MYITGKGGARAALPSGYAKTLRRFYPYLWHLPALLLFVVLLGYPLVFGISISFFKWNGLHRDVFAQAVGLSNYLALFSDRYFFIAIRNTVFFTAGTVVLQNLFGLALALFIFFGRFRRGDLIRATVFFPGVLAGVIVALAWKRLLMSDGMVNTLLQLIGVGIIPFLSDKSLVIWTITGINVWQWTGFNLVVLYAGLQSIDQNILESGSIDGATLGQLVRLLIVPILRPTIWLVVLFNVISGFRVFDVVYNLTQGGPAHSSEVLTTYVYFHSFGGMVGRMGYASALSVFLMLAVLLFTAARVRYIRGQ